jgi:hypothetical protein
LKDVGFTTTEPKTVIKINTVSDEFSAPRTTLKAEVTKDGPNDFKFEVTSSW